MNNSYFNIEHIHSGIFIGTDTADLSLKHGYASVVVAKKVDGKVIILDAENARTEAEFKIKVEQLKEKYQCQKNPNQ